MSDVTALPEVVITASSGHGDARAPRGAIKVNGQELVGWISWDVESNAFFDADTFRCTLAEAELPDGFGAAWWAEQETVEVEIFAGYPADPERFTAADLESLFFGRVDDQDWDPALGVIDISGRDLTSTLIDAKTSEKYPNNTASQIAEKLAAAHGLTPVVTATTTKVGRYYQQDRTRLHDSATEWDLLTSLAREEQFVVFVQGKELHFQPKPEASSEDFPVVWTPNTNGGPASANFTSLKFSRSLTLAKDIKVTVRSWNTKQKKGFNKFARRKSPHARSAGEVQEYSYTIANLTPEQAQQRADQILKELTQHERKVSISGPGRNDLSMSDVIQVRGTGTAYDQAYFPESITRSMDFDGGYRRQIEAKNHSPESDPAL